MAFNLLAAVAGFSTGAADAIEERNKELQRSAEDEIKAAVKLANDQNTKMVTRRSDLKETADAIAEYSQGRLTKTQIAGILQTPSVAKDFATKLKTAKRIEDVDFSAVYKLTGGQPPAEEEEGIVQRTIDRLSRPAKPVAEEPTAAPRGAFGLPSKTYQRTIAEGERAAGMSLGQMRATARGVPELTEEERIKGKLDLSQFDDPESITNIKGKVRDNVTKGIPLSDPRNAKLMKQLQVDASLKNMFGEEDGDKPRPTSAINSVFSKSLAVTVDPYVVSGVVRLVPETGDYVPVGGTAKDVASFQQQKAETIRNRSKEMGLITEDGTIKGGRNAMDALLPHANIKEGKIVSWKADEEAKRVLAEEEKRKGGGNVTVPAAASAVPAVGGGTAPVISEQAIAIPKGADGKADPTKLIPGQRYTGDGGKIKTWNGVSWQ